MGTPREIPRSQKVINELLITEDVYRKMLKVFVNGMDLLAVHQASVLLKSGQPINKDNVDQVIAQQLRRTQDEGIREAWQLMQDIRNCLPSFRKLTEDPLKSMRDNTKATLEEQVYALDEFIKNSEYQFRLFHDVSVNYPLFLRLLNKLTVEELIKLEEFFNDRRKELVVSEKDLEVKAKIAGHGITPDAFIILPVQRGGRYELLIRDLTNHIKKENVLHHSAVTVALGNMATTVNTNMTNFNSSKKDYRKENDLSEIEKNIASMRESLHFVYFGKLLAGASKKAMPLIKESINQLRKLEDEVLLSVSDNERVEHFSKAIPKLLDNMRAHPLFKKIQSKHARTLNPEEKQLLATYIELERVNALIPGMKCHAYTTSTAELFSTFKAAAPSSHSPRGVQLTLPGREPISVESSPVSSPSSSPEQAPAIKTGRKSKIGFFNTVNEWGKHAEKVGKNDMKGKGHALG